LLILLTRRAMVERPQSDLIGEGRHCTGRTSACSCRSVLSSEKRFDLVGFQPQMGAKATAAAKLLRRQPSGIDACHVGQFVRDTLVAVKVTSVNVVEILG